MILDLGVLVLIHDLGVLTPGIREQRRPVGGTGRA